MAPLVAAPSALGPPSTATGTKVDRPGPVRPSLRAGGVEARRQGSLLTWMWQAVSVGSGMGTVRMGGATSSLCHTGRPLVAGEIRFAELDDDSSRPSRDATRSVRRLHLRLLSGGGWLPASRSIPLPSYSGSTTRRNVRAPITTIRGLSTRPVSKKMIPNRIAQALGPLQGGRGKLCVRGQRCLAGFPIGEEHPD